MTAPRRIQLSRAKGWRKPDNTIVVARPSKWGNRWAPIYETGGTWRITGHTPSGRVLLAGHEHPTRADAIADCIGMYRIGLERNADDEGITVAEMVAPLRGKNLACWCPLDQPCHADVLLELANQEPTT
jgi:hypothetical protein